MMNVDAVLSLPLFSPCLDVSEGNRRFRALCETYLDRYKAATSKAGKSQIVTGIVDAVRASEGGAGGFVARVRAAKWVTTLYECSWTAPGDPEPVASLTLAPLLSNSLKDPKTNQWVDVGDDAAREKTGQQLRDLLTRRKFPDSRAESASNDGSRTPPISPLRSEPSSRKRAVDHDTEWCRVRRRGMEDGELDWMASNNGACASRTPLSRRASPPASSSSPWPPLSGADSAPPTGTDSPPELAPSVSVGGSNADGVIPTECEDRFRNQRFAMPACRGGGRASSLTPFWNSPLGVAADLREFFDHGEDASDNDDDGSEDKDSVSQSFKDRRRDKEEGVDRGDPLVGLHVPQF
jgi:hypothetical protein